MLLEVGYDGVNAVLYARFKNNRLYAYHSVPSGEYQNMLNAESCGKYLNQFIKPNYACNEVQQ